MISSLHPRNLFFILFIIFIIFLFVTLLVFFFQSRSESTITILSVPNIPNIPEFYVQETSGSIATSEISSIPFETLSVQTIKKLDTRDAMFKISTFEIPKKDDSIKSINSISSINSINSIDIENNAELQQKKDSDLVTMMDQIFSSSPSESQEPSMSQASPSPIHEEKGSGSAFYIPKILHLCWKNSWIPDSIYTNIILPNLEMTPNFDHRFYTNKTIMEFLQVNFPPVVLETYLLINPEYGACMSDFFRYCVLYIYGGVYMDIKSRISAPLDVMWEFLFKKSSSVKNKNIFCVSYWPESQLGIQAVELKHKKGEIMNWVLLSSPHHPFVKHIIDRMVLNIQTWNRLKYKYGEKINVLRLTGPIFLTRMILEEYQKNSPVSLLETTKNSFSVGILESQTNLFSTSSSNDSIFIVPSINTYFKYSTQTSDKAILYDKSIYEQSGIVHYSNITDQIVLFHSSQDAIISSVFYFVPENDQDNIIPLQLSFNKIINQSAASTSSFFSSPSKSYLLKPIDLLDTTFIDVLLKSVFTSLHLDEEAVVRSNNIYQSWSETTKKNFVRFAVLYENGGYFADSNLFLHENPVWDLYLRNVDSCITVFSKQDYSSLASMMSSSSSSISSSSYPYKLSMVLMKFPPYNELIRKSLVNMLMYGRSPSTTSVNNRSGISDRNRNDFLVFDELLKENSGGSSTTSTAVDPKIITYETKAQSTVSGSGSGSSGSLEMNNMMVLTIRNSEKAWMEIPENINPNLVVDPTNNPGNYLGNHRSIGILQFSGFPIGMLQVSS